jgi:cobalt-zinc-cadmium efflux system outer membrane protein
VISRGLLHFVHPSSDQPTKRETSSGTRVATIDDVHVRRAVLLLASYACCYGDSSILTLDEALAMADKYNPALKAATASVDKARANITTARAYSNPTITFGSLGRQQALQPAGVPGMLHGLNLTQPIEIPHTRATRLRVAQAERQVNDYALSAVRLEIRSAVKQRFYEALRNASLLEVARGNLALLEDLRRRIAIQVDVGEAARLELTRAEAETAGARIQVRSAQLRLSAATSSLSAAIGADISRWKLEGALERPTILPTLEELRGEVLRRHPAIGFVESQKARADAAVENEKALRVPQPSVWVDWLQQPEAAQYRFGVTIPIPVWNQRDGQIAQAVAERRRAGHLAEQRSVELTAALEQAYNQYQVAGQQVQIFETGTLRQAQAAVEAAQAAFKYGERGIIEVLDAQRVLRAARLEYLNAQFDRQQALIQLEQLRAIDTGGPTP